VKIEWKRMLLPLIICNIFETSAVSSVPLCLIC